MGWAPRGDSSSSIGRTGPNGLPIVGLPGAGSLKFFFATSETPVADVSGQPKQRCPTQKVSGRKTISAWTCTGGIFTVSQSVLPRPNSYYTN